MEGPAVGAAVRGCVDWVLGGRVGAGVLDAVVMESRLVMIPAPLGLLGAVAVGVDGSFRTLFSTTGRSSTGPTAKRAETSLREMPSTGG